MKSGVKITGSDKLKALQRNVKLLPGMQVLVGIPGENAEREGDLTNAQLGYIHEFGAPEANVPARPFLIPGIESVRPRIERHLMAAAKVGLTGKTARADSMKYLNAAGMTAVNGVRAYMTRGVPPPLADSTLRRRAGRRKGSGHRINKGSAAELKARAAGAEPSMASVKPLIDTGQLRAAVTYVIRGAR